MAESTRNLGSQSSNGGNDTSALRDREAACGLCIGGCLVYGRVQIVLVLGNDQGVIYSSCIGLDGSVQSGKIRADGREISQNCCRRSLYEGSTGYDGKTEQGRKDGFDLDHFELS